MGIEPRTSRSSVHTTLTTSGHQADPHAYSPHLCFEVLNGLGGFREQLAGEHSRCHSVKLWLWPQLVKTLAGIIPSV